MIIRATDKKRQAKNKYFYITGNTEIRKSTSHLSLIHVKKNSITLDVYTGTSKYGVWFLFAVCECARSPSELFGTARSGWFLGMSTAVDDGLRRAGGFVHARALSVFNFRTWLSPRFYIDVSTSYKAYARCGRRRIYIGITAFYWADW